MSTETYGNIEPETDWGYCPKCDFTELEWFEEGPICPNCGHLWDHTGVDSGSWELCMGEPWEESTRYRKFRAREAKQTDWIEKLEKRFGPATPEATR